MFTSEQDAAWYSTLRANKGSSSSGDLRVSEAQEEYHAFLLDQLCAFLVRGDYNRLVQLLLLLLPVVSASERPGLQQDLNVFLNSDAALAGHLAHQCSVMQRTILAAGAAEGAPKRAFAGEVLVQQSRRCTERLKGFCASAQWADVQPVSRPFAYTMTPCRAATNPRQLNPTHSTSSAEKPHTEALGGCEWCGRRAESRHR